jgi:hypothetical protein
MEPEPTLFLPHHWRAELACYALAMLTLDEYYTQLQIHEGVTALRLVAPWLTPDVEAIITAFRAAFDAEGLRGQSFQFVMKVAISRSAIRWQSFLSGCYITDCQSINLYPVPEQVIQTGHFNRW